MYYIVGCTGLVQPIDVIFSKPFKAIVEKLATAHMHEDLKDYVTGQVKACNRRILFTNWVGQAWGGDVYNYEG